MYKFIYFSEHFKGVWIPWNRMWRFFFLSSFVCQLYISCKLDSNRHTTMCLCLPLSSNSTLVLSVIFLQFLLFFSSFMFVKPVPKSLRYTQFFFAQVVPFSTHFFCCVQNLLCVLCEHKIGTSFSCWLKVWDWMLITDLGNHRWQAV